MSERMMGVWDVWIERDGEMVTRVMCYLRTHLENDKQFFFLSESCPAATKHTYCIKSKKPCGSKAVINHNLAQVVFPFPFNTLEMKYDSFDSLQMPSQASFSLTDFHPVIADPTKDIPPIPLPSTMFVPLISQML